MREDITSTVRLETLDSGEAVLSVSVEDAILPRDFGLFYTGRTKEIRTSLRTYLGSVFLHVMEKVADWHTRETVAQERIQAHYYGGERDDQSLEARIKKEKETILELHGDIGRYTIGSLTLLENAERNELHVIGDNELVKKLYDQMRSRRLRTSEFDRAHVLNGLNTQKKIKAMDEDFSGLYKSGESRERQAGGADFHLKVPVNKINIHHSKKSTPSITPLMSRFIRNGVPKENADAAVKEFSKLVDAYKRKGAILKGKITESYNILLRKKSTIDVEKIVYKARSAMPILGKFVNRYRDWRSQKLDGKFERYTKRISVMQKIYENVELNKAETVGMILDCPDTKKLFENHWFSSSPFQKGCLMMKPHAEALAKLNPKRKLNPNYLFASRHREPVRTVPTHLSSITAAQKR